MIIWLGSYPRSGNTLFRLVLNYAYNIKSYSVTNDPLFDQIGMSGVVGHKPLPLTLAEMKTAPGPYFVKTHEFPQDDMPAIYIVRDGRDTLVSYAKFLGSLASRGAAWKVWTKAVLGLNNSSILLKHLILPEIGAKGWTARLSHPALLLRGTLLPDAREGGWSNHVQWWITRASPTCVVRFEDMLKDPVDTVNEALKAIDCQVNAGSGETMPTFEELHAKWPSFFRRGKKGSWRDDMPPDLHDLFWRFHGRAMQAVGYDIDG